MRIAARAPSWALFLAIAAAGLVRIALTYPVIFQTSDESAHIACGVAWLERGDVSDLDHPPLARVLVAGLPYLSGLRMPSRESLKSEISGTQELTRFVEGDAILLSGGRYLRNLTLARVGVLPFFLGGCLLVWLWTTRLFGTAPAVAAVILFSSVPPILAHSGLATTDMALVTTLFGALYAFVLWLDTPDRRRSLILGLAIGLALLSKFSALLFLPACAGALLLARAIGKPRGSNPEAPRFWTLLRRFALAGIVAAIVVWAGYRFTIGHLMTPDHRPHPGASRFFMLEGLLARSQTARKIVFPVMEMPLPAPHFFRGALRIANYNTAGRLAYFLGEFRSDGWWYFFPVLLGIKTPLAFLFLIAVGWALLARSPEGRRWEAWAPLVCAATILLVCLPSRINIGLRHVLAIYPFLAMAAGFGLTRLWKRGRSARLAAAALAVWFGTSTILAHPDYLPYFNELAGRHPEELVVDSDLDWGQDVWRLRDKLRELDVADLTLGYWGTDQVDKQGLPKFRWLPRYEPVSGWVAISEMRYRIGGEASRLEMNRTNSAYQWLDAHPYTRVGKAFRLYYVAP